MIPAPTIDQARLADYDIDEHRHRYACWTAARAVQRGYSVKTPQMIEAIENSGLQKAVSNLHTGAISAEEFDKFHREVANKLKAKLSVHTDTTYGRVAKIIAIYIKTAHIMAYPDSALSRVAHPPIDRILLKHLHVKDVKWTDLKEEDYFRLINTFRNQTNGRPFWKLEYAWSPSSKVKVACQW